jgi:chemotaxis protein MotA
MITKFFGFFILMSTLAVVYLFESSNSATGAFRILHWPAIILTGIGPVGILFISSDWPLIRETLQSVVRVSLATQRKKRDLESKTLHALSQRYYQHGARAFEEAQSHPISPYLERTLKRLATRIPMIDVRNFLERERDRVDERLEEIIGIARLGSQMAPSVGMLGTILGMVQLLASLKDPSHIGSHMSLALLTTFYGLFFSLVLWTPITQHLRSLRDLELDGYDRVLHWLELMQDRKPTQYLSESENV